MTAEDSLFETDLKRLDDDDEREWISDGLDNYREERGEGYDEL